jgi:hypothetical protein
VTKKVVNLADVLPLVEGGDVPECEQEGCLCFYFT